MSDIKRYIRLKVMSSKDENVTRVDLRIPNEIFEVIERIAIKTNQPFTPKSKNTDNPKPIVTPVILKGLELVLSRLKDELISELTEGKITDTQIITDNLEERIFERLEKKLVELIEAKLGKVTADTITPENEDKEDINETITPENEDNSENEYIKNLNAIEVKSEVVKEDVTALEDINEDTEAITEDNSEPKEQGLSMGKLAERFKTNKNKGEGASKTSISTKVKKLSKEEFIKWTQENDPEGKAWQLNEADKLFYPVN